MSTSKTTTALQIGRTAGKLTDKKDLVEDGASSNSLKYVNICGKQLDACNTDKRNPMKRFWTALLVIASLPLFGAEADLVPVKDAAPTKRWKSPAGRWKFFGME